MFSYVESLHPQQLEVLEIIAKHESFGNECKTPVETAELIASQMNLKDIDTAIKLIQSLFDQGFIVNFAKNDTWGIKVQYSLNGEMYVSILTEDPIILTPKGRGYLQSHDLIMQIIQKAVNQSNTPESEKPGLIKKIYDEVADKGLDFLAKLCTEVIYRQS
ncbi:MAG: hypothetical protein EKK64_05365 [Neisseriaceae bacterium]|nr:MAG: hypothetical protein EKK64_05365 [Neisseriaceae bacterium]